VGAGFQEGAGFVLRQGVRRHAGGVGFESAGIVEVLIILALVFGGCAVFVH